MHEKTHTIAEVAQISRKEWEYMYLHRCNKTKDNEQYYGNQQDIILHKTDKNCLPDRRYYLTLHM